MIKAKDKIPTDNLTRQFDWDQWLQDGDTISVTTVPTFAVDRKDGLPVGDGDLVVTGHLVSSDGRSVFCMMSEGIVGVTYEVACTIWTNGSGERVTRYASQAVKEKL